MEDKQLTTEQSLDLIASMIARTRRNFNDRGGAMFLIWGYAAFFISPVVMLFELFRDPADLKPDWIWCLLPIVGGLLTWRHWRRYQKRLTTHLDRAVGYVWLTFAAACLVCAAVDVLLPMRILFPPSEIRYVTLPTLFFIVLIGGMATATTGLIIKFPPVAIGGLAGAALSFLMVIYKEEPVRYVLLSAMLLVAWIIPGHMLNAACRRERAAAGKSPATEVTTAPQHHMNSEQ